MMDKLGDGMFELQWKDIFSGPWNQGGTGRKKLGDDGKEYVRGRLESLRDR